MQGSDAKVQPRRGIRVQMWPLVLVGMVILMCSVLLRPGLPTGVAHAESAQKPNTSESTSHTVIEDEENPLASAADMEQATSGSTSANAASTASTVSTNTAGVLPTSTTTAIGAASAGVVVVAGSLFYFLKHASEDEAADAYSSEIAGTAPAAHAAVGTIVAQATSTNQGKNVPRA